jgi:hypothetical protein
VWTITKTHGLNVSEEDVVSYVVIAHCYEDKTHCKSYAGNALFPVLCPVVHATFPDVSRLGLKPSEMLPVPLAMELIHRFVPTAAKVFVVDEATGSFPLACSMAGLDSVYVQPDTKRFELAQSRLANHSAAVTRGDYLSTSIARSIKSWFFDSKSGWAPTGDEPTFDKREQVPEDEDGDGAHRPSPAPLVLETQEENTAATLPKEVIAESID